MPVLWWGIKSGGRESKPTNDMNPDKLTLEKLEAFARELRGRADLAARIHEDAETGEFSPESTADLLDALIGDIEDAIREVHQ
jgi:hypothetical protein